MSLLERLGLHRKDLRAWAMYDWANSAMVTTIVTAVFPIYFSKVAAADLDPTMATKKLADATTIGLAIIAVLSPILGTIADRAGIKKRLLAVSLMIGVAAVGMMFFIERGDWQYAAILFIIANIAVNASYVCYDSFLPHLAAPDEMDRVSTAGYALGYVGGGILLALNLAWIQQPALFGLPSGEGLTPSQATLPTRLAFLSVAIWWLVFSIPLFRHVPEPPASGDGKIDVIGAFKELGGTFRRLGQFKQAVLMLAAFLVYNDGIGTIIRMATIYGTELGIGTSALIASIMIVQFVGIPFAFLFGSFARRIGAKRAIFVGLVVYGGISVLGFYMKNATHFLILALLVGMVQGGTQALSRSLFAGMIPKDRSAEFFGFFAVVEKFAGIFGPWIFARVIGVTGSSRYAILAIVAFFVVGGLLLHLVDVEKGFAEARSAEAATGAGEVV
ncbi:MAG TPA: MFS transporter [Gemmatimonadales bacterium]|nr:MFS transporter [Gemmatimonadales bacterium]